MSLPHGGGSADGVRAPERAVHTSAQLNATKTAGLSVNGAGSALAMLSEVPIGTTTCAAVSSSAGPQGAAVLCSGAATTTSAAVSSSASPQGAGLELRGVAPDPQAAVYSSTMLQSTGALLHSGGYNYQEGAVFSAAGPTGAAALHSDSPGMTAVTVRPSAGGENTAWAWTVSDVSAEARGGTRSGDARRAQARITVVAQRAPERVKKDAPARTRRGAPSAVVTRQS